MIRVILVDDQELVRSGFTTILNSDKDIEVVGQAANGREAVDLAAQLSPDVICMDIEMPVLSGIDAAREIVQGATGVASAQGGTAPAILMLTTFGHEAYLFDALAAGASGFLLKTARAEQLIESVHTLAAGGAVLSPEVTQQVITRATELPAPRTSAAGKPAVEATHTAEGNSTRLIDDEAQVSTDSSSTTATTASQQVSNSSHSIGEPSALDSAISEAGLTQREIDVLLLVAQGKTNTEIADELFVGTATVKTHLSNLLQKIGARDRIQAVVWAHTRGDR